MTDKTTKLLMLAIAYCGVGLLTATVDHVVPRCKGGTDDLANLQLAHRICNSRKGGR